MSDPTATGPELVDLEEVTTAVIAGVVEAADMAAFFDRAFTTLPAVLADQSVTPVGAAFARHFRPMDDFAELEVGFPTDRPVTADGEVRAGSLPRGRTARYVHRGAFDGLPAAWEHLAGWIADQGLTPGDAMWEVYVTKPTPDMDPAELRTELYWSVR